MLISDDFISQFVGGKVNATIHIFYHMPDYQSVIQEFTWQTLDQNPHFPRINRFLDYWDRNIEAQIRDAYIACDQGKFKPQIRNVAQWYSC